jgi:hypothetical protein
MEALNFEGVFPKGLPSWSQMENAQFIVFDDDWTPFCIPSERYKPTVWETMRSHRSVHGLTALFQDRGGAGCAAKQ